MGRSKRDRIPKEVLKEIFPRKLNRSVASERVYKHLKKMILSGKLEKGKRLLLEEIARNFNVSRAGVEKAFFQLKKDRLIISKSRKGSFVA